MKKMILIVCIAILMLSGCSSRPEKPSEADVKKAFTNYLTKKYELSLTGDEKEMLDDYINCIVVKAYDDFSTSTLKKLVDAETDEEFETIVGNVKEAKVMDTAVEECIEVFPAE